MRTQKIVAVHYKNETPFIRLLFPFMAGIVSALFIVISGKAIAVLLVLLFILLAIHTGVKRMSSRYAFRVVAGIMLQFSFLLTGMLITKLRMEINFPSYFKIHQSNESYFIAKLVKPVSERPGSNKTWVEVAFIKTAHGWISASGKILTYFKKDKRSQELKYGDLICFSGNPVLVPPSQNPGEFNYKRFLSFHQVYHQVYIGEEKWCRLPENSGNPVIYKAYQVRDFFIRILKEQIPWSREFGVASALVIGYEEEVDMELIQAYASAGALHVLSVSGMHVGLIYQGLIFILGFMNRKRWSRHVLHSFLLCFLWFYAFVSGFSPSVARSALMLSIVIVARWHRGNTNVFNTLVVTAFGLLIYNPTYITEVGFQLSFMAVWGIIFFHPKIYNLIEPRTRVMHWIWELTSISVSAQLMTFPLGILYFHQFPNLFMLSNLMVIPLSGVIIYISIGVLIFSYVPFVGIGIAWLATRLLWLLNESVLMVERIPCAVINRLSISIFETWLIYLMLFCLTYLLITRKGYFLLGLLTTAIILNGSQLYEKYRFSNRKQLIFYNIPKQHAIDLIDGEKHIFIGDSSLLANKASMLFHVEHNWWDMGFKVDSLAKWEFCFPKTEQGDRAIEIGKNFLCFKNKRICIATRELVLTCRKMKIPIGKKIKVDYLVLTDNATWKVSDLQKLVDCKMVIIDPTNSKSAARRWINECHLLELPCYSVVNERATVLNID